MTKIDVKGGMVQSPKIGNLVRCVDDHLGLLNEGETEDGVDSDVRAGGDGKSCGMTVASEVRHMELKSDSEIRRYQCTTLLDNVAEGDGQIVGLAVDSGNGVQVCLGDCGKEVEIACR
jgi:hypothetical protein